MELDAAASGMATSGNSYRSVLTSILGRVFYSYKDRYLITATIRRDGSSKFGKNHHYGNFPSVSLGWNIAEESSIKKTWNGWTSWNLEQATVYWAIRKSDNYQYSSVVTTGINYPDGNGGLIQGAFPKNFANPDIKWESTAMTNIGIDMLALNSRLSLTMDYYVKNTSDILLEVPIPISTGGANDPVRNAGKIRNSGLEFNLGWQTVLLMTSHTASTPSAHSTKTRLWKWVLSLSSSQVAPCMAAHTPPRLWQDIPSADLGSYHVTDTSTAPKRYRHIRRTAHWSELQCRTWRHQVQGYQQWRQAHQWRWPSVLWQSVPRLPTYSLNGSVTYKSFDFAFTLQGVMGNKIYNATRLELEDVTRGTNYLSIVLDSLDRDQP